MSVFRNTSFTPAAKRDGNKLQTLFGKLKLKLLCWLLPNSKSGQVGMGNQSTRERWLRAALAQIPAGERILDAGAGELKYKSLCSHLDYVSQDFAQYDGQGDGTGLQTRQWYQPRLDIISDIADIPEPDCSFDAVMCIEVLEHVPYPVEAIQELARLLRPGGILILTAPFNSLTHYAPYYYYTGYSKYFYEYWLEKFGFEIVDMAWNGNYFEYMAQELRRLPEMGQTYAGVDIDQSARNRTAIDLVLGILKGLAAADTGSQELLSFGLQIVAKKAA